MACLTLLVLTLAGGGQTEAAGCPQGYSGTPPNCKTISVLGVPGAACPPGYQGVSPNCTKVQVQAVPAKCPSGYTGTPPDCTRINTGGAIIGGVGHCPLGTVWKDGRCRRP
jgi:hypothetical protein